MRRLIPILALAIFIFFPPSLHALSPNCNANDGTIGINTAIGCISTDMEKGGFVGSLVTFLIGLGGGIALLLILVGIFLVTTSNGIPEKLKAGNEIITSAIMGLVFMIMSVILLKLIGIDLLQIPGLS